MGIEQLLTTLITAWNEQDADTILSLFTEDGEYHEPMGPGAMGASHKGHAEIRAAIEAGFQHFPDGKIITTGAPLFDDKAGMSEWYFEFSGEDGNPVRISGVDTFVFENGKIKNKNAYLKQFVEAA